MEPADRAAPAATRGRGSVLVCDDTESIRRLLRINLELDGFEVHEANDGADALALLERLRAAGQLPKVIILDAQMAPRDGWWALEQIRACPLLNVLPVLMATAAPSCEDKERMRRAGLDACVRKPFDPDDVLALVEGFAAEGRHHQPHR